MFFFEKVLFNLCVVGVDLINNIFMVVLYNLFYNVCIIGRE